MNLPTLSMNASVASLLPGAASQALVSSSASVCHVGAAGLGQGVLGALALADLLDELLVRIR
ncbi:hypothetical protein CTI14_50220 [Methylobacterium radiotolerans]|nr:hypothetical protein CTI14_50220 [Methylobacterium radiotolerans]